MKKRDEAAISAGTQIIIILLIVITAIGVALYVYVSKPPAGQVHSLTISVEGTPVANGQDQVLITVRAYDNKGEPVSGANISIKALAGIDYVEELTVEEKEKGVYSSSKTSTWAGTYTVVARVEGTDITTSSEATFVPGQVTQTIVTSASPAISFYFTDAYGNIVPAAEVEPSVATSFGELGDVHTNPNDTFSADLSLTDWGTAEVTVTDGKTGVSGSVEVEYPPVYLEVTTKVTPPEIELLSPENLIMEVTEVENQKLSASISISIPPVRGWLGYYEMTIHYDSSVLHFLGASDNDPTDEFPAPEVENLSENSILIYQSGIPMWTITDVAVLDFQPTELVDNTPISVTDVYLIDYENWEPIEVPPPLENVTENGKTFKRLIKPIKAWIVEGSGLSDADVEANVQKAEDIYNKNARACRLKYWFVFICEINHIPRDNWNAIAGANGILSWGEVDTLSSSYRWGRWNNVYFCPADSLPDNAGGWWRPKDNIVLIDAPWDNNKSYDSKKGGLAIAHELGHEFSKSRVKDSPADPHNLQGAKDPKNLYNYGDLGDEISRKQGEMINEEIEKRRGANGLYQPYGPGPAPPP